MHERQICEAWTLQQREDAIQSLKEEKQDMTEEEYVEEYLGIASTEMKRFYDDDETEALQSKLDIAVEALKGVLNTDPGDLVFTDPSEPDYEVHEIAAAALKQIEEAL